MRYGYRFLFAIALFAGIAGGLAGCQPSPTTQPTLAFHSFDTFATPEPKPQLAASLVPTVLPVGVAPALVRVNSLGCMTDDWRLHTISTTIKSGSTTVATLPTAMASFIIETPGTYTANVTISGVALPAVTFTVGTPHRQAVYIDSIHGSDANSGTSTSPLKTLGKAISTHRVVSHTAIYLATNGSYPVAGGQLTFAGLTDVLVDWYGNTSLPKPVISCGTGNALSFWSNSTYITIRHIKADSPWTWATKVNSSGQTVSYHNPSGGLGIVRGSNIIIDQVDLGALQEGVSIQATNGTDTGNVMINQLNQTDPLGLLDRNIMIEGVDDLTVTNCTASNSINESPYRATGTGITRGFFFNCAATVDPVTGAGKAAFTIRQAADLHCLQVTATNNEFSVNWDISGQQTITYSLFDHVTVNNSQLDIRPGSRGCIYSNVLVVGGAANLPAVACSAETGQTNTLVNCQLSSGIAGVKFWNRTTLIAKNLEFYPMEPSAQLFAGDTSSLVNGGGNVVMTGATISGSVKVGSAGMANVSLYLDLTSSGSPAPTDPKAVTNGSGQFSFKMLQPGTYIVRQILPAGYKQVTPTNNYGNHVTVAANQAVTGVSFVDAKE